MGILDRISLLRRKGILLTSPLLGSTGSARVSESSDGIFDNSEIVSTGILRRRSSTPHSKSLLTRSKALVLICLSCIFLLVLVSLPSFDASSYSDDLKSLHADLTGKLATKWKAATSSTLPAPADRGLDRSWDYYAQNGIFVNARHNQSLPQNRRARFLPVDKIDELASNGLTGLEGEIKLGDGFDEIGKYIQGEWRMSQTQFINTAGC